MNQTSYRLKTWLLQYVGAWDKFWFAPRQPQTLSLLRVITGAMLLYSHLVLATDLTSFLGDTAWVNNETVRQLHDGTFGVADFGWTYLSSISNPALLWSHHVFTILVTACFAIGFLTRITSPLAWFLQLMYLHRMTGTLFGFDQIVTYVAMYLVIAPSGSCFSIDAMIRDRFASDQRGRFWNWFFPAVKATVFSNIATRLLQLHLCVIYLFGGISKARGQTWWDGTAIWYSVSNYEYQSLDMTWLSGYPRLFSAMSHLTLFWELFYCALIWPRITRPFMLVIALALHAGIALALGMITFGMMMIAANMVFVSPEYVKAVASHLRFPKVRAAA